MKTTSVSNFQPKSIARVLLGTALILMVPLIAMQFSDEVDWNLFDFIVMGALLVSAGLIYEWLAAKTGNKLLIGLIVAIVVILIWAELAVGVFGTPFAGS